MSTDEMSAGGQDDMKILRQSDVLAMLAKKGALKTEEVLVEEWGGLVSVRELTARERIELSTMVTNEKGQVNTALMGEAFLLATCYGLNLPKEQLNMLDMHGDVVTKIGRTVLSMSGLMVFQDNGAAALENGAADAKNG